MTLDGTNTWLLHAPGATGALVVDPGPDDEGHLRSVAARAADLGLRIRATLLTHGHPDHAAGARRFAELTGAPVRALDPAHRHGGEGLGDGDEVEADGLRLHVVGTPGHTGDSLSFLEASTGALLTGDTVLGRGTTVVAHPDGRLGDYLDSLERLGDLCAEGSVRRLLPGHGPVADDPAGLVGAYLAHRRQRLDQVRAAVAAGARTPAEVVDAVYTGLAPQLRAAAELSARAQLAYLTGGD